MTFIKPDDDSHLHSAARVAQRVLTASDPSWVWAVTVRPGPKDGADSGEHQEPPREANDHEGGR